MKRLIIIMIAFFLLWAGGPLPAFAKEKYEYGYSGRDKNKHKKRFHLFKHKKRARLQKWNAGHTEFKDRTKKDKRRLSRHHIKA